VFVQELAPDGSTCWFSDGEFEQALSRLRVWHRLRGFRGAASVDIDVIARAVRAIGEIYLRSQCELAEVETNPLRVIAASEGAECVVLEAVLLRADPVTADC
jgi:hypothetical protein